MSTRSIMLVGGPASGKTNYIARLWLSFQKRKGRLRAPQLPDDIRYVNDAVQHLMALKFVPRSERNMEEGRQDFTIHVRDVEGTGPETGLTVPDITGELWKRAVDTYELPQDWIDLLKVASSAVMFIRAHSRLNVQPMDWVTAREHLQDNVDDEDDEGDDDFDEGYGEDEDEDGNPIDRRAPMEPAASAAAEEDAVPANGAFGGRPPPLIELMPDVGTAADLISGGAQPYVIGGTETGNQVEEKDHLPAQVRFCELMRYLTMMLCDRPDGSKPRVAVVITAWDMLDAETRAAGPAAYLAKQFPLFSGRICTPGRLEIETFGLSVVGGNLRNPEFRKTLKRRDLSEVGYTAVMRDGTVVDDPDVTLPIAWALGG
ncbi:hypothetical protein [Novosphingobium sp.]|uniref:TRAFAC clade GTPase domain-containing protein n=1 Tax=Novosphingobium sp. TaxID=1874826 RepID=UPI002623788E|nr:hypothetical protein [Novosphingobium sp.]